METTDPNYIQDIFPDTITMGTLAEQTSQGNPLTDQSSGRSSISRPLRSPNWKDNTQGWQLNSNGEAQLNGSRTVSTNFRPAAKLFGVTVYVSNGTTPNGNLSGNAGDICLKGPTGNAFKCTSGTTWVSFT